RDTFLPSAIQRYHQLFMPSLQLVNALLATLSAKHATASNQVLPLVPPSELASTHSGFGAINSAILSLSTKCLAGGPWMEQIKAQTDAEIVDANTLASGFGPETKFEANVRRTEKTLRKALVAYAGATSDFTGSYNIVI
ncbi:hypothetical protein MPER_02724, partial [Moniliophthora perniciosa FA553]